MFGKRRKQQQLRTLLALFCTSCIEIADYERLKSEGAGKQIFLMGLFLAGAIDYARQVKKLDSSQFLELSRDVLVTDLGFKHEFIANVVAAYGDLEDTAEATMAEYGMEAAASGAETFRKFFGEKDTMATIDLLVLLNGRWKDIPNNLGLLYRVSVR